jgi:hypothetical protein
MNFAAIAQLPETPADDDVAAAPIDTNLFLLVGVGLVFAYYVVNYRIKLKN